jgi:hypothetical protein
MSISEKLFGDRAALAERLGVPQTTVRGWRQRRSIPSKYWPVIIRQGVCSFEDLCAFAEGHDESALSADVAP